VGGRRVFAQLLYSHLVEDYWHKSARSQAMKGGFMCRDQGAGGWLLQTSEWLGTKEYSAGPNIGAAAGSILVFDRENGSTRTLSHSAP